MKHAARRAIPLAVIAGNDDIPRQVAQIRDLATGEQREAPLATIADQVKMTLLER
jgi:histidyl-tRNA synthetase